MKKILFFDDDTFIISNYLVTNLRENYEWTGDKEITFVSSVDNLLKEINDRNVTYNLFVLDVMAPLPQNLKENFTEQEMHSLGVDGMNTGLVMAKKIRNMKKYKKVPILYLTARNIPNLPETDKQITAILRKPVPTDDISNKMKELLKIK